MLETKWYVKPNDLIGGWCIIDVDSSPGESSRYEIATFISKESADHIAELHNDYLEGRCKCVTDVPNWLIL